MACSVASIAFSQFLHRAMQFRCDRADVDLVCATRGVIARRANNESNFFWTWQMLALRPRAKSALQIAGQNGDVPPGDERADSRFEFPGLARFRSRALRKNNQDIFGIVEKFRADGEAPANANSPRKWQRVGNHGGDESAWHALKKIVRRCCRESAMQFAQGQSGEKAERVEMTGMVCHDDERSVRSKIFMPDNFEPVIDAQPSADDQCDQRAHSVNQHIRLARKSAQAINQWLIDIAGGIVMPGFHRKR